jgi:hypothetical protein
MSSDEVLAEQLPGLEARLAEASREYQAAYKRARLLKATIDNIKTLTGLDAEPEVVVKTDHESGTGTETATVTVTATGVGAGVGAGAGTGTVVGGDQVSIRNGILQLLNNSDHPWSLPELEHTLRQMGFMPVGLKTPRETVRNSANRLAMNNGLIRRVGSSSWAALTTEDEAIAGELRLDNMREAAQGN